jgi:hypothetical protein
VIVLIDDVLQKIKGEIGGLTGLSIINIMFGAFALAIGISTAVQQITQIKQTPMIIVVPLIFLAFSLGIAAVGFFWILTSVSILDFTTDLQIGLLKEVSGAFNEKLTSLIVEMTAFYRTNGRKIKYIISVTWIGGGLFMGYFVISVLSAGTGLMTQPLRLLGLILMLAVGISCFVIPRFFVRFAYVWDRRLGDTDSIQKTLTEKLGSR